MHKPYLHPRNRHQGHYDFPALIRSSPELAPFVKSNAYGDRSIEFADPKAVKALNRALLVHWYGLTSWEIPEGYLCPPIPGRADYVHSVADLLGEFHDDEIPTGSGIRGLDVGVGANAIYSILAHCEYGWSMVGSETDPVAVKFARKIVDSNEALRGAIEIREQTSPRKIFCGVIQSSDRFDFTICNPPFHTSPEEARSASERKWRNLGRDKSPIGKGAPVLNFGGQPQELWTPGGEAEFVRRMIEESVEFGSQVQWFTSLISKVDSLDLLEPVLKKADVSESRVHRMGQGQKTSRVLAWTFIDGSGRAG